MEKIEERYRYKIRVFGLDRTPGYLREEIQRGKLKEKTGMRA